MQNHGKLQLGGRYNGGMTGGCHCGNIRYEAKGEPQWVGACYCVDCRKIGGGSHTVFAEFKMENFKITQGKPVPYRSSAHITRSFCGNCGSPITYIHDQGDLVEIPVGTLDEPEKVPPQMHIWVSQKLPWVHICDDLPQREQ